MEIINNLSIKLNINKYNDKIKKIIANNMYNYCNYMLNNNKLTILDDTNKYNFNNECNDENDEDGNSGEWDIWGITE